MPHWREALKVLKDVVEEMGLKVEVETLEVQGEEDAGRHGFLGSPTIQIDGREIERERWGDPPYYGCRIYPGGGGVPPEEMTEKALKVHKEVIS